MKIKDYHRIIIRDLLGSINVRYPGVRIRHDSIDANVYSIEISLQLAGIGSPLVKILATPVSQGVRCYLNGDYTGIGFTFYKAGMIDLDSEKFFSKLDSLLGVSNSNKTDSRRKFTDLQSKLRFNLAEFISHYFNVDLVEEEFSNYEVIYGFNYQFVNIVIGIAPLLGNGINVILSTEDYEIEVQVRFREDFYNVIYAIQRIISEYNVQHNKRKPHAQTQQQAQPTPTPTKTQQKHQPICPQRKLIPLISSYSLEEKILNRINSIITLANDSAAKTSQESQAAANMAEKLMDKYGVKHNKPLLGLTSIVFDYMNAITTESL